MLLVDTSNTVHPQTLRSVSLHQPEARRALSKARDAGRQHVQQCDSTYASSGGIGPRVFYPSGLWITGLPAGDSPSPRVVTSRDFWTLRVLFGPRSVFWPSLIRDLRSRQYSTIRHACVFLSCLSHLGLLRAVSRIPRPEGHPQVMAFNAPLGG